MGLRGRASCGLEAERALDVVQAKARRHVGRGRARSREEETDEESDEHRADER